MKNEINTTGIGATLAHEIVWKEEQNIGIFFAAFAIQCYFNKHIISTKIHKPNFLNFFVDTEIYASQRVFVKNILTNKNFSKVVLALENLFLEYNGDDLKMPYLVLLSKVNKGFLIRQIFSQTDQILSKYEFINEFTDKDIVKLDFDLLAQKIQVFPEEQQILILARIFTLMKDGFEDRKKNLKSSFLENITRMKKDYESKGKTQTPDYANLLVFESVMN